MKREFGTDPQDLVACIGPSICEDCFEVGGEVVEAFCQAFAPEHHPALFRPGVGPGKYQLDLWAANRIILEEAGVPAKQIHTTNIDVYKRQELEGTIAGVKNYCIAVKEQGDDIVFLRKIVRGGADKSYGIQVAKLAGVPESVILRAKEIAEELSNADITARAKEIAEVSANIAQRKVVPRPDEVDMQQLTFFDTVKDDDIIKELSELEINSMTVSYTHLWATGRTRMFRAGSRPGCAPRWV